MVRVDGATRLPHHSDILPGVVLRMVNSDGSVPPFSDCLVTRLFPSDQKVALMRPHVRIENGLSNLHAEEFTVDLFKIISVTSPFRIVLNSKGEPMMFCY